MDEKKIKIMVILLSFQSGRNEMWCEKYLQGALKSQSKKPPEAQTNVKKNLVKEERIKYLSSYADKILCL